MTMMMMMMMMMMMNLTRLRTFARKFSNIDIFSENFTILKDNESVMSEM